jgi:hypothetical protein
MSADIETHEQWAARKLGIPVEQVTREMRDAAKQARFVEMYSGGIPLSRVISLKGRGELESFLQLVGEDLSDLPSLPMLQSDWKDHEIRVLARYPDTEPIQPMLTNFCDTKHLKRWEKEEDQKVKPRQRTNRSPGASASFKNRRKK